MKSEYLLKYKEKFNTPVIEKTASTIDELEEMLKEADGCKDVSVIMRGYK